jgi:hypothetical protein
MLMQCCKISEATKHGAVICCSISHSNMIRIVMLIYKVKCGITCCTVYSSILWLLASGFSGNSGFWLTACACPLRPSASWWEVGVAEEKNGKTKSCSKCCLMGDGEVMPVPRSLPLPPHKDCYRQTGTSPLLDTCCLLLLRLKTQNQNDNSLTLQHQQKHSTDTLHGGHKPAACRLPLLDSD